MFYWKPTSNLVNCFRGNGCQSIDSVSFDEDPDAGSGFRQRISVVKLCVRTETSPSIPPSHDVGIKVIIIIIDGITHMLIPKFFACSELDLW